MSKVIKYHQCVEADPCRVELLDPDTFFMREEPLEEASGVAAQALPDEAELRETAQRLVAQAQEEARTLVERARHEKDQVLAEAHQQAERIKADAHQGGVAEGRKAGMEEIRRELDDYLTQALARLAEADALREQRILDSEPEILRLAVAVAEKVLQAELELKPKKQLSILQKALTRIPGAVGYKIRLHPGDLEKLAEMVPQLQTVFSEPKQVEMVADPAVEPGGCFITTELGNVDARIGTQMELILAELLKVGRMR